MQFTLELKIQHNFKFRKFRRQEEENAYFDVDGLHTLGAAESYVTGYYAVSAIRWHRRVRFLIAKGKCDEAISPHEHARWRSPTRASRGGEDTF